MRKIIMILLIFTTMIPLMGCQINQYDGFNDQLREIEFEENGYIFFTDDTMIDGNQTYSLKNIFTEELVKNSLEFDFVNYEITVIEDVLFAVVSFRFDQENQLYQAIIVYDFIELKTLYFEQLPPNKKVNDRGYEWQVDEWYNFILYSEDDNFIIYQLENNIINKEDFIRPEDNHLLRYRIFEGKFIRYTSIEGTLTVIDTYDYLNKEEYVGNININILEEISPEIINYDGKKYQLSVDIEILLEEDNNVLLKKDVIDLYKTSVVGNQVNELLKELNLESDPTYYQLYISNNDIYLYFVYERGFLFNRNILGKTPYIIFRFDLETEKLIYIGLEESFVAIYNK